MATEGDNTVITVDGDALQLSLSGCRITEDGRCESDMRTRLGMAKSILTELEHIWKSRAITTCTKLRLLTPAWFGLLRLMEPSRGPLAIGHIYQQTSCCSQQRIAHGWRSLVCRAANVRTSE